VPRPGVDHRPSDADIAALNAAIPPQPRHVAVVFVGDIDRAGWWGSGRRADWSDAVEVARIVARAARTTLDISPAGEAPWHPGRCARLELDGAVIGYAGELHPRVLATLGLPERVSAMELDLDRFSAPPPVQTPICSTWPWSFRPE
jgi:phenylalanyl-tRNA synthetase beta chain